ncbi:MAG: hypothetical protein BWY04_01341 [candidate division CPR1 bacterium ADurb.Bin160]|jgi:hypothetical protein|uniref:Uncharacterized protein n=1 Tax=candidate division CPR1 bacterium ADurb.Bin160 TaxID=1852826 RepID=A0A1V5ZKA7_9BACT|nr:MAG: hypothetical protein BWY04_01341 [candidate division CPR1 bacterium ADurb.Bin160]
MAVGANKLSDIDIGFSSFTHAILANSFAFSYAFSIASFLA